MTGWLGVVALVAVVGLVWAVWLAGAGPGRRRADGPYRAPVQALRVIEAHCLNEHRRTEQVLVDAGWVLCLSCGAEGVWV